MKDLSQYEDRPSKYMRNHVIELLKANYAEDNLELEEFEERMEIAEHTTSKLELSSLVRDLPEIKASEEIASASSSYEKSLRLNTGEVENSDVMVNIFSGADRKGVWKPPKQVISVNIFGGSDMDFREALLNPGVTRIRVLCFFGGADIIVPPGVNVKTKGIGFFGGFSSKAMDYDENLPTIVVEGLAIFGGVDVKIKGPKNKPR